MRSEEVLQHWLEKVAHRPVSWEGTTLVLFAENEFDILTVPGMTKIWCRKYQMGAQLCEPASPRMQEIPMMYPVLASTKEVVSPPEGAVLAYQLKRHWQVSSLHERFNVLEYLGKLRLPCFIRHSPSTHEIISYVTMSPLLPIRLCQACHRGQRNGTPFGLCPDCKGTGHASWPVVLQAMKAWEEFSYLNADVLDDLPRSRAYGPA